MSIFTTIETQVQKMKFIFFIILIATFGICFLSLKYVFDTLEKATETIYVLSDNTPIIAYRTDLNMNRLIEYKAQIDYFHSLFFNITSDNKFIESNIERAMFLIDKSGWEQYTNLKESGFYNQIVSTNTIAKMVTDSINIENNSFVFYGKQIINRKGIQIIKSLVTAGNLVDVPRSENNSHGVVLTDWRVLENDNLNISRRYE